MEAQHPNVVFALSGQHSAKALGHRGHPDATTPNLDRMSAEGVAFENAIGQAARSRHPRPWHIVLAAVALAAASAEGADRIRFLKATDLAGLGLRVRLMSPCTARPLPSPTAFNYRMTSGDSAPQQVELYDPAELWVRSQHAGCWVDDDDSTLTLASVTHPLPRGFPRKHVSPAEYDTAIQAARRSGAWDQEALTSWVRDFTGATDVTATQVRRPSFQVKALIRFDIAGMPGRLAYATMPTYRRPTAEQRANPWLYVQVDLAPGHDRLKSRSAVEQDFIGTLAPATAATRVSSPDDAMQGRDHAGDDSEAFRRSREAAAQSIRNMRDWWYVETAHFVLLSNLTSKHRPMVQALQDDIEQLHDLYTAVIPPIDPIESVSVIRIFATQDEYVQYVGPASAWTGGLWMPAKKELVIRPTETGSTRDQREQFLRITYHESFHQYLFYALGKRPVPAWFNEGHADFFEQADIQGQSTKIEEDADAVELVTAMIEREDIPIDALLAMDYPQFYDPDAKRRRENYALAWALIYYMRKGAILERPARYHTIPDGMIKALAAGASADAATAAAFADVNRDRFRANFIAFWTSRSKRGAARRVRVTSTPSD